ncbi:MAG: hypothetical protein C4337_05155 [Armatimonadota bacterium]
MKAPVLLGECILRVVRAFARRYRVALGTETYREVNAIAQGAAWEWLCQQFSDPDGSERWEEVELSEEQGRAVMGFMWNELRDWWREEYRFYRHCEPLEGLDEDGEWRVRELEDVSGLAALEGVLEEAEWESLAERLGLSDRDRAIVRLLCDGYTQSEVAEQLGLCQSGVAKRLARIRRLLAQIRGDSGDEAS